MTEDEKNTAINVVIFGLLFATAILLFIGFLMLMEKLFGLWGVSFVLFTLIGSMIAYMAHRYGITDS